MRVIQVDQVELCLLPLIDCGLLPFWLTDTSQHEVPVLGILHVELFEPEAQKCQHDMNVQQSPVVSVNSIEWFR